MTNVRYQNRKTNEFVNKAMATFKALADDDSVDTFIRAGSIREYVRLCETNAPVTLDYANRLVRLPLGKTPPTTSYLAGASSHRAAKLRRPAPAT